MRVNVQLFAGVLFAGSLLALTVHGQTTPAPAPPAQPAPPTPPAAPKARPAAQVFVARSGSYLGIGVAEIDAERAKALNLKEERGVEVKSVEDDSPAAKAGAKVGDVVLEYNGQRVEGTQQFVRMVQETPAGRPVRLVVSRNGSVQTLTGAIGTRRSSHMVVRSDDGESFNVQIPPMPPMPVMPVMPDFPRNLMSWRSTTLGVESESLTSQLAEFFGVKEGVLVRSIIKDSAAEKAGIKAGDVIVKIDDTKVTNPRELSSALRGLRGKRTVPVVVVRSKQEQTLTVTFDEERGGGPRRERAWQDWSDDLGSSSSDLGRQWGDWGREWGELFRGFVPQRFHFEIKTAPQPERKIL